MKAIILKNLASIFIIVLPLISLAQTITTTAGSVTSCPAGITVSIDVTNCNNIGAISLVLEFDSSVLTYNSYVNAHSELSSGYLIVNSVAEKVIISWASSTAANIGSGTLIQFNFTANSGTSNLTWDTQTPGNCEYSDVNGNVLADSYTNGLITIHYLPVITTQPQDKTIMEGGNTSFSVSATGTNLNYQWQLSTNGGGNWGDISGATGSSYNITGAPLGMSGYQYRCIVGGQCPPDVTSDAATLYVNALPQEITTTVGSFNICPGGVTVAVSVEDFTGVGAFSLTLEYTDAVLTYDSYQNLHPEVSGGNFTANATAGKVFMVWTSTTTANIGNDTLVELNFSSIPGISALTWDTQTPGSCEYSDSNGNVILSSYVNGNITINSSPSLNSHPSNQNIEEGQNAYFSISASGSSITYQWQISTNGGGSWSNLSNGGNYSGATSSTLSVLGAPLGFDGNMYRCWVNGMCPPDVYSNSALLTVYPLPQVITTTAGNIAICPGVVFVPISVTDFTDVGAFSLTLNFDTAFLTYSSYQNLNPALSVGTFIASATGTQLFMTWVSTTAATIGDGVLFELIYTGTTGVGNLSWDTQTPGACEYSDGFGNIILSTYYNGTATVYQPPVITSQPVNASVITGQNAIFSISATGAGLGYQWQESTDNGNNWFNLTNSYPYSGVYTSSLTISAAPLGMNGYQYRCIVTGTCPPSDTSNAAVLYVSPPVQVINTTIGSISNSCTGNLVVPVNVTNCNNVGAISLTLNYNPDDLVYDGYQGIHSELSSGILVVNDLGDQVKFSWASINPANIGNGVLLYFKFIMASGSSSLTWNTQNEGSCEFSDSNGNVIQTNYYNGTVSVVSDPLIANAGNDATINAGSSITLNGAATGGTPAYDYLWTPSSWLNNPLLSNPLATPPSSVIYTLTVTDNNLCVAANDVSITVISGGISVDLKVFLEGPFNGIDMNTNLNANNFLPLSQPYNAPPWNYYGTENVGIIPNTDIVDWVMLELRDAPDVASAVPATTVSQKVAFLLKDGSVVHTNGTDNMTFDLTISDSLYMVILHRNHLSVMSAVALTELAGVYSYDFSTGAGQVYGGAGGHKNIGADIWGMIAGDADGNGEIESIDKDNYWTIQAGEKGYKSADFDMSTQVMNQDKNDVWVGNIGAESQVPE